jgi:Ulp1 family protease
MNSYEITNILSKHCPSFGGVFPSNKLSNIANNSLVILNTDPEDKVGSHWVALYVNKDTSEFFDSLGNSPRSYHKYWHTFLMKNSKKYIFNDLRLQNFNSSDCGKFCIFYVVLRSSGIEFKSIIKMLQNVDLDRFLNNLISS